MSEDKIKRRRFLADILFAGGAISAAALLARATQSGSQATPEPQVMGGTTMPPPDCASTPEAVLGGKPTMPTPDIQVKGEMALPTPRIVEGESRLPQPHKTPEVHLKGKVALPQPKQK